MTAKLDLSSFDAVTFDFYGTIVDWEPEILEFLRDWTQAQGFSIQDSILLETYDRVRQPLQAQRPIWPYPEVLTRTLDAMALEFNCELPPMLRAKFGGIAANHQPFSDSIESLLALRQRGLTLGALSNIDEASFDTILNRLKFKFDISVTAERVGAYKPDKAHFIAALADLQDRDIPKNRVLHVAQSKRADIVPATELGVTCVWVERSGHVFGRTGSGAELAKPDYRVSELRELLEF